MYGTDNAQLLIELHTQKQHLLIQYKQIEKSIIQAKKGDIYPGNYILYVVFVVYVVYYIYCFIYISYIILLYI